MKPIIHLITFMLIFVSLECFAKVSANDIHNDDIFKIKFINASGQKILINGNKTQKNSTFRADSKITWANSGDYIRAENLRTHIDYKISGTEYKRLGATSLANYIHKRYTGTKGGRDNSDFESEGYYLSNFPWELLDGEVEIPVNMKIDDNNYYVLRSVPYDKVIVAQIDEDDGKIFITQEALTNEGILPIDIHNYTFRVVYIHDNSSTTLTDNFIINYIPTINYSQE